MLVTVLGFPARRGERKLSHAERGHRVVRDRTMQNTVQIKGNTRLFCTGLGYVPMHIEYTGIFLILGFVFTARLRFFYSFYRIFLALGSNVAIIQIDKVTVTI